jgi:hypothetical protein
MNKDIDNNADEKLPVEIDYSETSDEIDDQKDQLDISKEVERIISSSNDNDADDQLQIDAEDDLKNANIEIKK